MSEQSVNAGQSSSSSDTNVNQSIELKEMQSQQNLLPNRLPAFRDSLHSKPAKPLTIKIDIPNQLNKQLQQDTAPKTSKSASNKSIRRLQKQNKSRSPSPYRPDIDQLFELGDNIKSALPIPSPWLPRLHELDNDFELDVSDFDRFLKSPLSAVSRLKSPWSAYPRSPRSPQSPDGYNIDPAVAHVDGGPDDNIQSGNRQNVIKQLLQMSERFDKILMTMGAIFSLLYGCAATLVPFLYGFIFDNFGEFRNGKISQQQFLDNTTMYVIYFVIIACGAFVLSFLSNYFWSWTGFRQYHRLVTKFFESLLLQDISLFDDAEDEKQGDGDIKSSGGKGKVKKSRNYADLISEGKVVRQAIQMNAPKAIKSIATDLCALVVGLVLSPKLAAVFFSSTVIVILIVVYFRKLMQQRAIQQKKARSAMAKFTLEIFEAIRIVFAFNGSREEQTQFGKLSEQRLQRAIAYYNLWAIYNVAFFVFLLSSYALVYWYGGILVSSGEITGGNVVQIFMLVVVTFHNLTVFMTSLNNMFLAFASAEDLFEIIHMDSVQKQNKNSRDPLKRDVIFQDQIEFRNVSFAYPARPEMPIFDRFNLSIQMGKFTAIVGASGSGKSSVVGLLMRFYQVQDGSIVIDGTLIQSFDLNWLRSQIALVSQEPFLFDLSIYENLLLGNVNTTLSREEVIEACKITQIHSVIESLPKKYDTQVGVSGSQLSGGQRQRIVLARALLRKPQILILDEGTSYLDVISEQRLYQELSDSFPDISVVVIAHRLKTIQDADQICVMDNGRVVEQGSHEELIQLGGKYNQLIESQGQEVDVMQDDDDVGEVAKKQSDAISMRSHATGRVSVAESIKSLLVTAKNAPYTRILAKLNYSRFFFGIILNIALFNGVMNPVYSYLLATVLTAYSLGNPDDIRNQIIFAVLGYIIFAVVRATLAGLKTGLTGRLSAQICHQARLLTFQSIIQKDIPWFDRPENIAAVLSTRVNDDTQTLNYFVFDVVPNIVEALATSLGGLGLALYAGWKLTLIVLAIFPILFLSLRLQGWAIDRAESKVIADHERIESLAKDCVDGIRTVSAYNLQHKMVNQFRRTLEFSIRNSHIMTLAQSLGNGLFDVLIFLCEATIIYAGSRFLVDQGYTFNQVLLVFSSIVFCASALSGCASVPSQLSSATIGSRNLLKIIEGRKGALDIQIAEEQMHQVDIQGNISIRDVSFHYPQRKDALILDELSISIRSGQHVGIVGTTGSGKSTIFVLLEKFYRPSKGSIYIEDVNIRKIEASHLRKFIAIVPQQPTLFNRSIRENIIYGLPDLPPDLDIDEACKNAAIYDFIQSLPLKYDTVLGDKGIQISGGERQRICIARALLRKPRILLLDEFTSALDAENEIKILNYISQMRQCTVITIAHRLKTIRQSDVIFVMKDGKVEEKGTDEQLLELGGLYSQMINV
ncbi:hypothetical protein MIR68_009966 [Amoeboaphelidium protococcarum]|nr:hypothetical protein MIR68_009966 [Amoeboaphelidium protococcarum]